MSVRRERFIVQGQVQGVGFRPFVFSLAEERALSGFVRNSPHGVVIEVQGSAEALDDFALALKERLPPLARPHSLHREPCAILPGENAFSIARSTAGHSHAVLISPDTATCADCLADIRDPAGRRFHYPFTNCTNCGPRYTITRSIPYDRASTSMACFPMCPDCQAEYENPRDRRFHAQPNACPVCGPKVWFVGSGLVCRDTSSGVVFAQGAGPKSPARPHKNSPSSSDDKPSHSQGGAALAALAEFLHAGGIAAIKGLGGFHLACDARNHQAVMRLRQRKNRPHKPFALMAANLEEIRRFALVGQAEEKLLLSPERPIVLCPLLEPGEAPPLGSAPVCRQTRKARLWAMGADNSAGERNWTGERMRPRPKGEPQEVASQLVGPAPEHKASLTKYHDKPGHYPLSPGISPDTHMVGVMLPYTPLHVVLFEHLRALSRTRDRPAVLVMTSGNPAGEPICLSNREAAERLGHLAEAFLFHDRDILIRADDSVLRVLPDGSPLFLRRARGYVPRPLPLPEHEGADAPCVLGVGAELKNTLCLTKGSDAFVSQHIGDMANLETAAFHADMREHLAGLLQVAPQAVVRDLHPDYLSSQMADALGQERGLPVYRLQHHFAHAHAVLAEHRFQGKALVLALDGTGLGTDGKLWGGELLLVHTRPGEEPLHTHVAAFAPLDLPGGETAIREPWRIAHALLLRLGLYDPSLPLPWLPEYENAARLLPAMLERRINTPVSTSCGRLFDAVAALLGLCNATTYEGQAAIRLEEAGSVPVWRDTSSGLLWAMGQDHKSPAPSPKAAPSLSDAKLGHYQAERLYPCPFTPDTLDTHALFAAVHDDIRQGEPVSVIARRFHRSLAVGLAELAAYAAREHGITHVGLSGGCLQNATLAIELSRELEQRGLIPLRHRDLPPGDGCISLGQAAWGRSLLFTGSAPA
ncbi:MAG: carbamoyltransferase HypF [Desulfovibrionaceae bacterium]|nr:carbamoyltransferase HypF [Desulfovibrionaceae bacterium]